MLPRFRPAAFGLFAVIWFVSMLLGDRPWAVELALDPDAFARFEGLWQPLTAMLFQPVGRGALAGTLLVLWVCASPLEGFWGMRRYLLMVTCGFLLNASVMFVGEHWGSFHYLLVQALALVAVVLWNFVLSNTWVFRR